MAFSQLTPQQFAPLAAPLAGMVEDNAAAFTHMTGLQPLRDRIGQFVTARKRRHELAHLQHTSLADLQQQASKAPAGSVAQRPARTSFPGASAMYPARGSGWAPRAAAAADTRPAVRWERTSRWPVEPPPPRFTTGHSTAAALPSAAPPTGQRVDRRRERGRTRPSAFSDIPRLDLEQTS